MHHWEAEGRRFEHHAGRKGFCCLQKLPKPKVRFLEFARQFPFFLKKNIEKTAFNFFVVSETEKRFFEDRVPFASIFGLVRKLFSRN